MQLLKLRRSRQLHAVSQAEEPGQRPRAYIVEVTGKQFGEPFPLTLAINEPENCQAAKTSAANASISEHSVYNEHGAAFVMIEYGSAGLRILDLRDRSTRSTALTDPKYPYK